jgi:hypothetical protein
MDLSKAIEELRQEKTKLERAIASLEDLQRTGDAATESLGSIKRRGRTSMPPEERREVSERMKRYWAARRKPPVQDPGPR